MNLIELNQALVTIVEKKQELRKLKWGNESHKKCQQFIQDLETEFHSNFGSYLDEVLFNIHDEYCPDNTVQNPLSYLAQEYTKHVNGRTYYDVDRNEGVRVEADDFPGINARLVLIPGPARLVLQGEKEEFKETVWVAEDRGY